MRAWIKHALARGPNITAELLAKLKALPPYAREELMKPPAAISDYMRKLQKRGVASRLRNSTAEQRKEQASAMAKARWAKAKGKP